MRIDPQYLKHNGYEFIDFISVMEEQLHDLAPLSGSYVVIKCEGKYLMCYNSLRQQWELPAGKREAGESPKECAVRELFEETGQRVKELSLIGLLISKNVTVGSIKRNPVYFSDVKELQPFVENDESTMITLWDKEVQIGFVDALDMRILEFVS